MSMQGDDYGPNYRLVLIPSPFLENEGKQIYIRWAIFHTHYCCMKNFTGLECLQKKESGREKCTEAKGFLE